MKWPVISALIAAIFSLFGRYAPLAHTAVLHAPSVALPAAYHAQAATAAGAIESSQPTQAKVSSTAAAPSIVPPAAQSQTPTSQIMVERVPSGDTATLSARMDTLVRIVGDLAKLIPVISQNQVGAIDPRIAANGSPAAPFAAGNAINNLSNVTISNPTISGGSVPASSISGTIANAINTISGAIDSLTGTTLTYNAATFTSATSTNFVATNATTTRLATNSFTASATSTLAGMTLSGTNCSSYGNGGKLTTDANGNVICGADQGGSGSTVGGSDTQIQFNSNGSFAASSGFTFASSSKLLTVVNASTTNLTASYASSTNLFAGVLTLTNALGAASGGTGIASPLAAGVFVGAYAGGGWQQLATSSLGLLTSNVAEGSNLYFTNNRVASVIAGTTTTALAEGNNLYFTSARADARISATSTIGTLTSAPNLGTVSTGLTGFLKAAAGVLSNAVINLASDVTGILPVANGGTGWASIATGAIPYGNGSGALATTSAGTAGYVLAYLNGVPTWTPTTTLSTISGTLAVAQGGTGATSATGATNNLQFLGSWTGSVARTLSNKLADVISVKDFGAACDGVTDDTTAISNAIAAVPSGGTLVLPTGSCLVSGSGTAIFTITKMLSIIGQGDGLGSAGSRILVAASVPTTRDVFHIVGTTNATIGGFTFRDFTIIGQASNGLNALHFDSTSGSGTNFVNVLINNVYLDSSASAGGYSIYLDNGSGVSSNGGFYASTITHSFIGGGIGSSNTGDSVVIANNIIHNSSASTPAVTVNQITGAGNFLLFGNNISGTAGSVVISKATAPIIENNEIEQQATSTEANNAMIDVTGSAGLVDSAKIVGNQIQTAAGFGNPTPIRVASASGTVIDNNRLGVPVVYYPVVVTAAAGNTTFGAGNYSPTGGSLVSDSGGLVQQPLMQNVSTSNVGIGNTSPSSLLSVGPLTAGNSGYGITSPSAFINAKSNNGGSTPASSAAILTLWRNGVGGQSYDNVAEFALKRYANVSTNSNTQLDINLSATTAATTTILSLLSSGNVGIGTTTPGNLLAVNGTAEAQTFSIDGTNYFNAFTINRDASSGQLFFTGNQSGATGFRFITPSASAALQINATGGVGIGTTSPSALLAVQGKGYFNGGIYQSDSGGIYQVGSNGVASVIDFAGSASDYGLALRSKNGGSTLGVLFVDNSTGANTTVGSITWTSSATTYNTSSDRRIKENIATTTLGLAQLMQLPVRQFDFISDPSHATTTGFVAQELYPIFPWAVTTNGDDGTVALGTSTPWSVDYGRITPLVVKAVQDIASLSDTFRNTLIVWLGNVSNGIVDFFAANGHFSNELCVGATCVTPQQFAAMVAAANQKPTVAPTSSSSSSAGSATTSSAATPPVIQINGDNPAIIQVGSVYNDLGATITGPQADLNLGIKTFLNGSLTSNIVVDASQAATDTIEYVVTDQYGLTATSTRTVIVQAAIAPPQAFNGAASSTSATSTAQ